MIELVIVSRLLEYPDAALAQHQQELFDALAASENLDKEDAQKLGVFLRDLLARDLLDAQADYSQLFDRGRATSLLLFEHVHGESRDRGQAMVDLMAQYEQHGLQLDSREAAGSPAALSGISGAAAKRRGAGRSAGHRADPGAARRASSAA